jgi:hypothetical protein
MTNDPLPTRGRAFARGELTDSVFFGLAANPKSGSLDVQFVEFQIPPLE